MTESYKATLQTLAEQLVQPQRFQEPVQLGWGGEVALAGNVIVVPFKTEVPSIVA